MVRKMLIVLTVASASTDRSPEERELGFPHRAGALGDNPLRKAHPEG
jgi:hypothetical protein